MVDVPQPFDIVITSNSGYPLDLNLYQAAKGMSAAAQIVKPGGAIIVAAECWDGIPDHGEFKNLLHMTNSPQALLEIISEPTFSVRDQWEAQIQALIQLKAEVHLKLFVPYGRRDPESTTYALQFDRGNRGPAP